MKLNKKNAVVFRFLLGFFLVLSSLLAGIPRAHGFTQVTGTWIKAVVPIIGRTGDQPSPPSGGGNGEPPSGILAIPNPRLIDDAEDLIVKIVVGKITVTYGHMKRNVNVPVDQFIKTYARKDFGLNLDMTDFVREDKNALYTDKDGNIHHAYGQYFKPSTGGLAIPVLGSRALLIESGGRVTQFSQGFVRGLDQYVTDITPKITMAEAEDIVTNGPNMKPVNDSATPQMSLLPSTGSEELQNDQPTDSKIISGTETATPPPLKDRDPFIGFVGPREAQNARLMWRVIKDLDDGQGPKTFFVDAITGKIIGEVENIHYGDTPDGFFGKNAASTGIPYPFYNIKTPIPFTANLNENTGPYLLMCQKTDVQDPKEVYCATSLVMQKKTVTNKFNLITSPTNEFNSTEQNVPVSIFAELQKVSQYFLENFKWSGFRNNPNDKIFASVGTETNKKTNAPTAYYQNTMDGGPGKLAFDGFGNGTLAPIASTDLVGHEYFHGIFQFLKDPSYQGMGLEVDFIDEGLADFFGDEIESLVFPNSNNNWKFGEQLFGGNGANGFLRDLANPKNPKGFKGPLPDTYEGDYYVIDKGCPNNGKCFKKPDKTFENCSDAKTGYCDRVHRNSLVISHMLQLLSDGTDGKEITNDLNHKVSIQGIGRKNVSFTALDTMQLLQPNDTMRDFCTEAVKAAKIESTNPATDAEIKQFMVKSTQDACFAVGLGERFEGRFYDPSVELKTNENVPAWPTKLTWQVFPELGENYSFVEVANYGLNDNFPYNPNASYEDETALLDSIDAKESPDGKLLVSKTFNLSPGTGYRWRICTAKTKAELENIKMPLPGNPQPDDCAEWHEEQWFITEIAKEAATPISPKNVQIDYTNGPVPFEWTTVKNANDYVITMYKRELNGTAGAQSEAPQPTNSSLPKFSVNGVGGFNMASSAGGACWSVTPRGVNGSKGMESEKVCYTIKPEKVSPDSLSPKGEIEYPSDGLVKFSWKEAGAATSYKLKICPRDPNLTPQAACDQWGGGKYIEINEPSYSGEYVSYPLKDYVLDNPDGYCWGIVGVNEAKEEGDELNPSEMVCYSINTQPELLWPVKYELIPYGKPDATFQWKQVPGAKKYVVYAERNDKIVNGQMVPEPDQTVDGNVTTLPMGNITKSQKGGSWAVRALFGPDLQPGEFSKFGYWEISKFNKPGIELVSPGDASIIDYKSTYLPIQWISGGAPEEDGSYDMQNNYHPHSDTKFMAVLKRVPKGVSPDPWDLYKYGSATFNDVKNNAKNSASIVVQVSYPEYDWPKGGGPFLAAWQFSFSPGELQPETTYSWQIFRKIPNLPEKYISEMSDVWTFSTGVGTKCGDGMVNKDDYNKGIMDECDNGPNNSDSVPNACRTNCKNPHCGDGITDSGEQCDDGNGNNGDKCESNCTLPFCGNGIVDPGELCDNNSGCCDTSNNKCAPKTGTACNDKNDCTKTDTCNSAGTCVGGGSVCGDDVIENNCGEQCDGSHLGGATCPSDTTGTPTCSACAINFSSCQKKACNPPTLSPQNLQPVSSPEPYIKESYYVVPTTVQLTWSPVPGATSYGIEYYEEGHPEVTYACNSEAPQASFHLANCKTGLLTKGWKYIVVVKPKACGQFGPGSGVGIEIE